MRLSPEREIKTGFGLALSALVVLGLAEYQSARHFAQNSQWVVHSNQVLRELETAVNLIDDAEAAERGYVMTGGSSYLKSYQESAREVNDHLNRLHILTADNSEQQQWLRQLQPLVSRLFHIFQRSIELRRSDDLSSARELIFAGSAQEVMTSIRMLLEDMRDEEFRLLRERNAAAEADHWKTLHFILLGTFVALAIISAAAFLILSDVRQRVQAERELQRERDLLHTLMDNIPDFIYFKDTASRFTRINRAQARALGLEDPAEALGKTDFDYFTPEHAQEAFEDEQTILRTGKPVINKIERASRPGQPPVWVSTTKMSIRDLKGEVIGTFGVSRDMTERRQAEEALRASEEKFRAVSDTANDAIISADQSGKIRYWNAAAERIFGYSESEVLGKPLTLLIPQRLRDKHEKGMQRYLETGQSHLLGKTVELAGLRKDGSEFPLDLSLASWRTAEGVFFTGLVRDITVRKQAEKALLEAKEDLERRVAERTAELDEVNAQLKSELALRQRAQEAERQTQERFRFLFAHNPLPMWVYDLESLQFLEVNGAAIEQYGYSREEFLRMRITDIRPPEDIPKLLKSVQNSKPGLQHSGIWQHRRKDGEIIECEIISHSLDWGGRGAVLTVAQNVTERRKAERALRESELRLRRIVDLVPHRIFARNQAGRFLLANRAVAEFWGTEVVQVVGKTFHSLHRYPEEAAQILRNDLEVIESGVPKHKLEERLTNASGEQRILLTTRIPFSDAAWGGQVVLGVSIDITDLKRAEEEIRRLNESLESRVQERTAQLEEANKELEAFTYSVAHDLRAPLRHMSGFARILVEDYGPALDENARHYLDRVSGGARHMGQLVDDLLNLSRVGRKELSLQLTPLDSLVKSALDELGPELAGREIEWRIRPLPSINCDATLLKQVFVNLLSNAVKYTRTRERAVIEVGQTTHDQQRVVFVRDNGIGFDMAYSRKLFGIFQRLHSSKDFEGTGVGLAIVQRILQKHGWRIWTEAAINQGATFFFTVESRQSPGASSPGSSAKNGASLPGANGMPNENAGVATDPAGSRQTASDESALPQTAYRLLKNNQGPCDSKRSEEFRTANQRLVRFLVAFGCSE